MMKFLKTTIALTICMVSALAQNLYAQEGECWDIYMKANTAGMQFNDSLAVVYYRQYFDCNTSNSDAFFGMSLSMANLSQIDSSMIYLEKAIAAGFSKGSWLTNNPSLDVVKIAFPQKWDGIIAEFKEQTSKELYEKGYNERVYWLLDSLHTQDQRLLHKANEAYRAKESTDGLLPERQAFDTSVMESLDKIIETLGGAPTIKNVGVKGENNAFLLVQHLDNYTDYQKAYFERIKNLPASEINPMHIAYLTDRTRVNAGLPQLFGTQVNHDKGEFYPIDDPKNLSKRLAEYGFGTIEDWLGYYSEVHGVPMPDYVE